MLICQVRVCVWDQRVQAVNYKHIGSGLKRGDSDGLTSVGTWLTSNTCLVLGVWRIRAGPGAQGLRLRGAGECV